MDAWKGAATKCRRLRKLQLQVSHQRSQQMASQALQHWANRWSNLVQHQQNLREFDVACWHRSCRRAMDAWCLARQWEVRVAQQMKSSKLQLQRQIFEAWMRTWKAERKEALLLLQSDQLQRRLRLRRSFRVLQWHAEQRQGQMGWIKRWWILARLSRRSREVEALQQKAENFARHRNRQLILNLLSTWHIYAGARRAAGRAGQRVRRRHQQVLLLKWRKGFEAREAARVAKCQQAVKHSLLLRSFGAWAMWYRRNLSIRRFASKVFSRLRRKALTVSIHGWAEVARELAARETRYLLQVNDFQRKRKRQAHLLLLQAWHREAKASADATRTARLRKVFACWRLTSQEQRLLQKYLQECATISFQGSQSPKEVSVGPAELERIYREMADYRWNVDAWDLSD